MAIAKLMSEINITPDSEHRGFIGLLPHTLRGYALLARFDRPIGFWLLFWPCVFGLGLSGGLFSQWRLMLWMLLGAVVMRGAGCVYNDIIDRDLDGQVARTASRPLPSGQVTLRSAWIWLIVLCLIGFIVLLQLNWQAQLVSLGSLALVAAYPFMKRITWWPQAWLGMVFSWGALTGWIAITGAANMALFWLYAGTIFWVIGYDTIYATQDREDDALVGIRSSALRLGGQLRGGVMLFYALALIGWGIAIWSVRPQILALAAILPAALHLLWQATTLDSDGGDALEKFRSNRMAGLLMALACIVVGASA
jgi:4-hydroxybenzoate polyprenyltransferase